MSVSLIVLQARAARDYGVPWDAFDTLTPFELSQIAEDYNKTWTDGQKLKDSRAANIAAAVYRCAGQKVKESDFFHDYGDKPPVKRQTNEEMIARIKLMFGIMG